MGYNIVIRTTNRGKTPRDNGGLKIVKMGASRNRYSTVPSTSFHILKSLHDNLIINGTSCISFNITIICYIIISLIIKLLIVV